MTEEINELHLEIETLRRKLFPYADAPEISGMSWNGFYLIGDRKSVRELQRLENRSSQLEEYQDAFIKKTKALEEVISALEADLSSKEEDLATALEDLRYWKSRAREAEHELTTGEGY